MTLLIIIISIIIYPGNVTVVLENENEERDENIAEVESKKKKFKLKLNKFVKHKLRKYKNKNIKGNPIDDKHQLHMLTISMIVGLRSCLKEEGENSGEEALSLRDFVSVRSTNFHRDNQQSLLLLHSSSFSFKTYAPKAFARLFIYYLC